MKKGVSYKSIKVISKSYVRPYLEYCVQIWALINSKDANILKGYREEQLK